MKQGWIETPITNVRIRWHNNAPIEIAVIGRFEPKAAEEYLEAEGWEAAIDVDGWKEGPGQAMVQDLKAAPL